MKFSKKEKSHENKKYRKLYTVWHHMMNRCYDENDKNYHSYGKNSVRVSSSWQDFDGFASDIDYLPGWDENGFMSSKLQLDKDFIVKGNKIYSKETCCWISGDKNKSLRPNLMKPFVLIDEKGKKSKTIYSKSGACKSFGISYESLNNLLNGNLFESIRGYQAVYIKDIPMHKYPKTVYCMDRAGEVHRFYSKRQAINSIKGLTITGISSCLEGPFKSYKGYQFSYDGLNFVEPSSIQYNINRELTTNIGYFVTDRTMGTEYCILDEKLFSKYSGLIPKEVHRNAKFSKDRRRKPTAKYVITKFTKFSNDYRKDSLLFNE